MILDQETQMVAVEKVLEEMQKAEEYVRNWNASWMETCLDANCMSLYRKERRVLRDIERKYHGHYFLSNIYCPENRIGEPLKKVILIDDEEAKHECEFGRIEWYGMESHKSRRHFSFHNNGDIRFEKMGRRISYDTYYNVLSDDFMIELETQDCQKEERNHLTFSLNDNILTKRLNQVEITQDLNTGRKSVKIEKKAGKHSKNCNPSVFFEAVLDKEDLLERGIVIIHTHKGNGKVNGTYQFDVSKKKGIRVSFYSRKGDKLDLTTNPILLEWGKFALSSSGIEDSDDIMISSFVNSVQDAISKNLTERMISFDQFNFDIDYFRKKEAEMIVGLKAIKGELPLTGLVERIDYCLDSMDMKQNLQITNPKTLKLGPQK